MSDQPLDNLGDQSNDVPSPNYDIDLSKSQAPIAATSYIDSLYAECAKVIIGQTETIELIVTCILADGHILLEGVPV